MDATAWGPKMMSTFGRCAIVVACATVPLAGWAQRIVDLGPYSAFQWTDINDAGQVVGFDQASQPRQVPPWPSRSVLVDSGGVVSTLWSSPSVEDVVGINNRGAVVGSMRVEGEIHAATFASGAAQDLGTLGGSYSTTSAVNDAGQIVGYSTTVPGSDERRAFLYSNGAMTALGTLGGAQSEAFDINSSGQIVGQSQRADGRPHAHAFLLSDGRMTDLGALLSLPPGAESVARALNDRGQVVGGWRGGEGGTSGSFLYADGVMTTFGTLGGSFVSAYDINDLGRVVGSSTVSSGASHAFVYSAGVMTDLNTFAAGSGWTLESANEINDRGEVVGYGNLNGELRWFLLTSTDPGGPVAAIPEPGTFALFGIGALAMVAAKRWRKPGAA